jgi:hypothetical protein
MTGIDKGYASLTADLFPNGQPAANLNDDQLPYADVAQFAHGPLCDTNTLLDFLRDPKNADRVRQLIRPPFGRFADLAQSKRSRFRDPRVARDSFHDMRMPPYMRDSDQNPLSITFRQYDALMKLLDRIEMSKASRKGSGRAVRTAVKSRLDSPIGRDVEQFAALYRRGNGPKKPRT